MLHAAAFDLGTGELLWSTESDPTWRGTAVVSDPTVEDGRLYLLATRDSSTFACPVFLVSVDAQSGRKLWERLLGSHALALPPTDERSSASEIDVFRWGNPPTVRGGAVYASTNLGFVARADARDGLVDWVRAYPRFRVRSNAEVVASRMGGSPVVIGDTVVFAPRDLHGAFALEATSGALLWDRPFLPSEEVVGPAGGAVILSDRSAVVAVDARSGEVLWERKYPQDDVILRPLLRDGLCHVPLREGLDRLDAASGREIDGIPWEAGEEEGGEHAARAGREIPEALALAREGPALLCPGTVDASLWERALSRLPGGALSHLPLELAARVPSRDARIFRTGGDSSVAGKRTLVLSSGALTCLSEGPSGVSSWSRILLEEVRDIVGAGELLVLVLRDRVEALQGATGALRWEASHSGEIQEHLAFGSRLFLGSVRGRRTIALLDLATGLTLWERQLREGRNGLPFFDGAALHLIAENDRRGREDEREVVDLTLDARSGEILTERPMPGVTLNRRISTAVSRDSVYLFAEAGMVTEYFPRTGRFIQHPLIPGPSGARPLGMRTFGDWLLVRMEGQSERERERGELRWLLHGGRPTDARRVESEVHIEGERAYSLVDGSVSIVSLPTGGERRVPLPPDLQGGRQEGRVLAAIPSEGSLWVVWAVSTGDRQDPYRLRVDRIEERTGRHLGFQLLRGAGVRLPSEGEREDGVAPLANGIWSAEGALWIVDSDGVAIYAPEGGDALELLDPSGRGAPP
jgi:outer membrane protein assembly factor BamB